MLKPGQQFGNPVTGQCVEILETSAQAIRFRVTMPQGNGVKVEHLHDIADEEYWIESGWLSYRLDGKMGKVGPGEAITLPRNRPHAHWNADAEPLVYTSAITLSHDTDRFLEMLFSLIADDKLGKTGQPTLLQLMAWQRDFTSKTYLAALPKWLQHILAGLFAPLVTLLGYRAKRAVKTLLFAFTCAALAVMAGCGNHPSITMEKTPVTTKPKHFVFIPGSFHGAWCWYKMQPLLSQGGNTSEAVDLPGHGLNEAPASTVTLDAYVEAVGKVLDKYQEPVILVGHSRAGIVISQVAERMPEKIDQLVYLCAFLIPNGEPMVATALTDSSSVLVSGLIFNEAEGWHIPKKEIYREAFYHDCSEEDIALCSSLLSKEPNAPVGTPLQLSPERFGKVPKTYIFTTEDKAITYALQQKMVKRTPVNATYTLKTSHSPFLSRPVELADILRRL